MTPRWLLFVGALTALSVAAWASAIAGAGSGTALIAPSAAVPAGSTGTWSIQYTADEAMKNGRVLVTIPSGWTAPQSTGSSSAGYVTIATNEPTGNPLVSAGGQVVTVDVDTLTAGNTLTIVYGDDTGGASARATATTAPGSYPFEVESDPAGTSTSPIAASPSLSVVADAPDHIEIAPSDTTVVAGTFSPYVLIVRDQYGNRAPVASTRTVQLFPSSGQFFTPANHSTPITSINIASGKTSVRIDYKGTLATNGSPHSIVVLTSGGAPSLAGSDDVNIVAAALSTTQSTVSATSPIVADGITQSSVTVTSKDAFGNPRSGDTVAISVTGSAVRVNPPASTDANGEAVGAVTNTVAQAVTVSATINAQAITDTAPITFVAGAVSAATSVVNATTPVVANGVATSTITVTAKDANGNPVSGQSVTLSVLPAPNATLTQPGGVTDAAGVATGTLASSTTGARTVSAVIGATAITDDAVVNFTAGAISTFAWVVDGAATAGVAEAVTLTAQDAQGHTVTNFTGTVNLSTTPGALSNTALEWAQFLGLGSLNNLTNDNATYTFAAGDNGTVTLQVTDTRAETVQLNAVSGAASKTSSNIIVSSNAADVVQLVAGNGQSATVNTAVSTSPQVQIVDAYGNPVAGTTVTFSVLGGGGSVDAIAGGGVDNTRVSGADGTAICDVWKMGTLVNQNPNGMRAQISAGTTPSVDFSATATAGSGFALVITPGSQNVTASSSTVLTATLTDSFGNAKSGDRIDISINDNPADGTLASNGADANPTSTINGTARFGNADVNGKITVLYQAPAGAGVSDVVDASTSTVAQGSVADRTYTTTASGATSYRITFVGGSTAVAGTIFHFKVEAVDGGGNVDSGNNSTATLTPEAGSGPLQFSLIDFGSTTTSVPLVNGTRDVYGRGTLPGNWDITASGSLGPDTDPVIITPAAVDHYDIATINPVVAGASFNVSVTARDQFGNLVTGAGNSITLSAIDDVTTNPAQSALSVGGAALVAGQATVSETYTTAESIRVRVSDSNSKIGTSNVFAVSAAAAYRIVKGTGDSISVIAGAGQILNVLVLDLYDNPVPGVTVNFAKVNGPGSIPASDATDAGGNASQTLTTGTLVGTTTVKATILDENPALLERADFSVTTVAGPIANYLVSPSKTNPIAHEDVTLTVTARDVAGNARTQDSSTIIALSKTGSAVLTLTSGPLNAGVFTTTVHDDIAESFTVNAQTQGGGPSGTSPSIVVTNAPAYQVFIVSGNANGVTAGATQPLTVVVKDIYGNTVPNEVVTFAIASPLDGTASLTDTVGDPSDGITLTDGTGQATVTCTTALTAGTNSINAQILDGAPLARERVTFSVGTVAGGISYYTVEMNATVTTAGVSKVVTVTAYDSNDNPVDNDVTQVTLAGDPGAGLVFTTNPVTLTNGVASTNVTANLVQSYKVRASTVGNPGVTGLGPFVSVVAAAPAGLITASATKNTITANGTSTTTITSGVIKDTFGNQVAAGLNVNVAASIGGTIVGGSPKQIAGDGTISFDLQSSTTAGISTVNMTSATGTASGSINITFAPKPALVCDTAPVPAIVVPGQSVSFQVQADNGSATSVNLTTATTFTFSDGTRSYSANLTAPQSIPGNGSTTLVFNAATVNASFLTANYAPVVTLIGTDQYTSPVNVPCTLPAASLLVTSIEITGIVPNSGVVSRGQSTFIAVTVKNNGSQSATISDVDLVFIPADLFTVGDAAENGSALGAGASKTFNVPVTVLAGATVRTYQVDASATGTVGAQPVVDNSVAPHPLANLQVTAAANLAYEPATLSPTTVTRGKSYSFQLTLRNQGGGLVVLDSTTTRLTFTDGVRTYSAAPSQPYAIAGGGATQTMTFRTLAVPAAFVANSYPVTLDAHGTENGSIFVQSVPITGSPVLVQAPSVIASVAVDALTPDAVSKTTTAILKVQLQNTGGATVVLTPATTTIKFASNQYSAALNPTGPVTLAPGTTQLEFLGATVTNAITPGTYFPTVQLTGFENGIPFSKSIVLTDGVDVQNAPSIAILDMKPSQAQFTADQSRHIKVRMIVSNTGGVGANFTSASLRFIHAGIDRTSQFVVSTPSTFAGGALLSPAELDTVVFDIADNTGNPMTAGNMTIEGALVVTDVNTLQPINVDTDLGGKGNLQVMTPAVITFDAVTVSQPKVTQNMTKTFQVHAIVRNTGGSDAVLTLTNAATHLNFAPSPGWVSNVQSALVGGGTTLSGGEVDEIILNVTTSGSTPGPATIDVVTAGVESNSGSPVSGAASGLAGVLVQTPGSIQVTNVVPSRATITGGSTASWTVTVTLTNPGGSDVDLALGGAVVFSVVGATAQPAFTIPSALAGGGVTLSAGETDQFVVSLTTTGNYAVSGQKDISVTVNGTEQNSGAARGNTSTGSVIIEKTPDLSFVSLLPGTVSKLTTVSFSVIVNNVVTPNGATVNLDRSLTRLRFGSNQFNVGLTQASAVDVASGSDATLLFTGAVVGAGIPDGVEADAQLELHWTQNGIAGGRTINLPTQITVQSAPSLSILSVRPSRSTMTRQQSPAGTVTMVLHNAGGAAVDLDLSSTGTRLGFKVLSSGATVTSEYIVQAPVALESAGGIRLAGGATDSLVFDLTQAGTTTGSIIVNGYAAGTDLNSGKPVTDDTFDGGSGNFDLQLPGALSILSITPSQPTATAGQTTGPYTIKMAVKNTGGAAVNVTLAGSSLSFPGTSGWSTGTATMPSGNTLSGGETDTLRFAINTTGGPAGVATIAGTVSGSENNTGAPLSDNTASGGTGSITLQTPAQLIVDSVTPSQPSITTSTSAAWNTTVVLHNAGQSAARLDLPAGFTISIQSSTGGTVFVKPVDLEEGGILLAGGASGTLVANTTSTGTFSTLGTRQLNVSIGATEINSDRGFSAPGTGAVLVQSAPNLVVTAIRPVLVTSGSLVDFEVDVQDPGGSSATVHLDRATTRARFASNAFSAVLDVSSPDSIVGGDTETLRFEGKVIPTSIAVASYDFNVDLNYAANHVIKSEPEVVTNGVAVQAAPQLFIQQIVVSQPTATAGQARDWTATMTVTNNGAASIDLDLAGNKTFLTFIAPDALPDNTYVVNPPVMASGSDILVTGETDQIIFTIAQTGTRTGNIVISGKVTGTDLNQLSIVTDDTFDGGRGGVLVQTPAVVAVTAIHPTQPRVTQGQGGFSIRVVLANTGGSDVAINLPGTDPSFTPSTGWAYGSTQPLQGGGNILEGGAVDSLSIDVQAGTTTGLTRIDADVPWTELNSSHTDTTLTASSGFGQVRVEGKADVRVFTTVSASPNPNAVNVNQDFNIQVTIQNQGEADARDIVVSMTTSGGSIIQPVAPFAVVPGGQSVSYMMPVTAAAVPAALETFTTSLDSAIDENSGQSNLVVISPGVDKTAALAVETPADVNITKVHPSQPSVTRGQVIPWNVIVAIQNPGQSAVNLTPPVAGDLDFSIAGSTKIDYIVQAPTKFGSGASGWTLAGGAADSLVYNVTTTGNDTGTVDIALGVAGNDRNDPPQTLGDSGATSVRVQDVAGLAIASTFPVGTVNHASAARDTVNTGFPYEIHVTVQNTGGEDVDSVLVQLTNDGGANGSVIADATKKRQAIVAGGNHEFVFRITTRATPDPAERFSSTILPGVKSHNSGQTVVPQQPIDNLHDVVIQTRANLSMNLWISSPPGSAGGVVGTGQAFTLSARVSNGVPNPPAPGEARLSGPAFITLTVPPGFAALVDSLQTFAADDTVRWNVTAPLAPQAASDFSCAITTIPNDINTAAAAFVSKASDLQSVIVSTGGALANPTVALTAPAGATDDTLSAGQSFTLHCAVTVNHVKSLVSTLSVPAGYSVVGSPIHNFPNGVGTRQFDYAGIIAPALPSANDDLYVTFAALDTITGAAVPSVADTVRVTLVPRTSLAVSAAVTAPPDAIDNTVAVAEQFTITATVANVAGAADIAAPGSLTLALPVRYSLASGQVAIKSFTAGVPVLWVVNASAQPSGPDQFAITISGVPADENSGQPAQVTTGTANIAMVTEGSAVSVRDVSSSQNVGTPVAPGGATNLDIMAFQISYNVTDTNVSPAELDTVALTIIDKSGVALGPNVVAQTLKRLALDLGGAQPYEVLNPNTNPVIVSLKAGGTDRHINPDGSIIATVYLDLDPSPRATEFRVRMLGAGIVVSDPGSPQKLGVTDAQGQALDLKSGPLVILSSNFEEYAHNYPNPFSAGGENTKIAYFLDAPSNVSIKIYAITGDLVHEESIPSSDPRAQAGPQEATWDGRNDKGEVVRNGVYVCVLNAGSRNAKFRIAVAK